MAAMFDLSVTPTSEGVRISPTMILDPDLPVTPTSDCIHVCLAVFLDLKSRGTRRKFGGITFESRHPIYIQSDGRQFD